MCLLLYVFSKRKRIAVNTSIRSQLGFESEQMASSGHYQQHLPKYFSPPMSLDILEAHHLRFVDFLVTSNSSFNVCCNKELGIFMRGINPSYTLPSRRLVLDRLLQKRYSESTTGAGRRVEKCH